MLSIVKSMSLHGLDGYLVHVQVDVSSRNALLGNSTDYQIQVLKNLKKEFVQQ